MIGNKFKGDKASVNTALSHYLKRTFYCHLVLFLTVFGYLLNMSSSFIIKEIVTSSNCNEPNRQKLYVTI